MCLEIQYIYKNCGCVARTAHWTCGTQKLFNPPREFDKECPRFATTTQTQRLGNLTCGEHVGRLIRVVTPEVEVYERDFGREDSDGEGEGEREREGKRGVLVVGDENGDGEGVEGEGSGEDSESDSESEEEEEGEGDGDDGSGDDHDPDSEEKANKVGVEEKDYKAELAAQVKGLTVNERTLGGGSGRGLVDSVKKSTDGASAIDKELPVPTVKGLVVNGKTFGGGGGGGLRLRRMDGGISIGKKDVEVGGVSGTGLGSGLGPDKELPTLRRMDGGISVGKKDVENGGVSAWGVEKELPTLRHVGTGLGKKDAENGGSSGVDKKLPALPPKDKRRTPSPEKK